MKRYVIDLDHTLCDTKKNSDEEGIRKTYTWIQEQIRKSA